MAAGGLQEPLSRLCAGHSSRVSVQAEHHTGASSEIRRQQYELRIDIMSFSLPLRDEEDDELFPDVANAYGFIDKQLEQGHRVLVHCVAGISRSSAVVLYYLMRKNRWPYETALAALRQVHPGARPNSGYQKQLALYAAEQEFAAQPTVGCFSRLHRDDDTR